MKAVLFVFGTLALLGSGCSIGDSGERDKAALKAVAGMQPGLYVSQQFPSTPKSVRCVMKEDVNLPGNGPSIRARGICTTLVTYAADGATVVLFRETWDAKDFDGYGDRHCGPSGCSPLTPSARMHTWEFTVTKAGDVSSSRNYGDRPPQYGYKY